MTAGVAGSIMLNGAAQLGRGQRPDMQKLLLTPKNVTRITKQLAQMRGAAMKMGQLMSMDSGEFLPPELAQIMARLRDNAHSMPPAQLKQVLNAQWPKNWLASFKTFDVHPIAAASIGQVHRAQLKDGRDLAVKVQYPGVTQSIDSDIANVGSLMRMSGLIPKGFEIAPYLEEAKVQLHEEADYLREGTHLAHFQSLLAHDPRFVVPDLHSDWSTPNILAMSYVSGTQIEDAAQEPQKTRDQIAAQMIELTLREMFRFGAMQTDPNFANYLYRADTKQIVLLDFGAAREIDPIVIEQYRQLLRAGLMDDMDAVTDIIQDIGFVADDTSEVHRTRIMAMIGIVFDTLRNAPLIDFAKTDLPKQLQADGIALAEDGFVPPTVPFDVLLLQRKLGGVFLLAARLGAKVDVRGLLDTYLS
jgi:predicted unusual protein kinase regulating ubiquinone biosynthesis (AarF/ABC1/UbiB family)